MTAARVMALTLLAFGAATAALAQPENGMDKVPLRKGEKVVFLGDSITQAGVGPKGYVSLIKAELDKSKDLGVVVLGAGISGNKVPDLQRRLERDVLSKKPGLVVVYIGINDVWHGETDPKRGTDPKAYEAGLKDVVGRVHASGARVLLCTPTVIGELPKRGNKLDKKLDQYADISRKVAREMKVPLCDLRVAFVEYLAKNNVQRKDRGILTTDGVHLNDVGNRVVAESILRHLDR